MVEPLTPPLTTHRSPTLAHTFRAGVGAAAAGLAGNVARAEQGVGQPPSYPHIHRNDLVWSLVQLHIG